MLKMVDQLRELAQDGLRERSRAGRNWAHIYWKARAVLEIIYIVENAEGLRTLCAAKEVRLSMEDDQENEPFG